MHLNTYSVQKLYAHLKHKTNWLPCQAGRCMAAAVHLSEHSPLRIRRIAFFAEVGSACTMDFERDVIFRVGPPSLYRTCKNPARHSSPQKNHAIMRKFRGWSALSFEKHKDQGGATSGGRRWRRAVSSAYIHQHHP